MADLNILRLLEGEKMVGYIYHIYIYLIYSVMAITEIESYQVAFPPLLYANRYTFILLLSLFLLCQFPSLYSSFL